MKLIEINEVRGYIDENGTAQLNLEDISRGLGFIQNKNGVPYVRWDRVNGYLTDMGFPQLAGKDFIPENVFYRLSMKGETESAIRFQSKVADEILPNIRKHGAYMTAETIEKTLTDPDFIIRLATELKTERAEKELLAEKAKENAPKVALYDVAMCADNNQSISKVAKSLNYGPNKLFKLLREKKVLFGNNVPYQRYIDAGYFTVRQVPITRTDSIMNVHQPLVTAKGMAWIHKLLQEAI